MPINKTWINNVPREDRIIVVTDKSIFRIRTKEETFYEIKKEVSNGIIRNEFVEIPMLYLWSIKFEEEENKLRLIYKKDSEEEIWVSNLNRRREIFEYFKLNQPPLPKHEILKRSVFSRIKKPLIALGVILGIFAYVLFIINDLNQGYTYRVTGRPGIGTIALGLAGLGLFKNILIFAPLALIALFKIIINYKNNRAFEILKYR